LQSLQQQTTPECRPSLLDALNHPFIRGEGPAVAFDATHALKPTAVRITTTATTSATTARCSSVTTGSLSGKSHVTHVPRQPLTARNMNSTAATVTSAASGVYKDVSAPTAAATAVNRAVTGSGIANNVMAGVNSALGYDYRSTTTTTTTTATASSAAIATTTVSARSHSVLPSLVRPAAASVLTATTASQQQRNKQAFEIFADPSGAAAVTAKAVTTKAVTSRGGVTGVSSSGISKCTPPRTAYVSSSEQQQQRVATAHLASVRAARTTSAAAVAAAADKENAYGTTAPTARAPTAANTAAAAAVSKQPVKSKHNVYPLSGKVMSVASPSFGATSSATKAYQRSRAAALSTKPNGTTAGTNAATTTAVRRLHSSPMSVEKPQQQQQQQQYADAVARYRSKSASVKLGTITNNNNNSDNMDVSCDQMTAAAAVTTATPPPVTATDRYQSGSYKSDDMSPADSANDRNNEQQAAAAVVAVKTPAAKRGDAMQTSDGATTVNASAKGSGKQPDTIMCMHKRLASVTDTAIDSSSSDTRLITSALARATISDSLPPLAQQQQQPPVSVTRYVDYTSKYGIGFLLSDGSAGVYFNDATKMVIAAEGEMFQYIERTTAKTAGKTGSSSNSSGSSDVHNYTLSDFPVALQKKTTLLTHFRNYLREQSKDCVNTPSQRSVAAAAAVAAANSGAHVAAVSANGGAADACLVHVKKFVRTRHAILFRLSNRSVQVVFFDQTEVLLVDEARSVTYVDKAGVREHMLLCDVKGSKRADLIKRLQYTKDMMGQLTAPLPQAATAK
jgi:POLO box duplicated region